MMRFISVYYMSNLSNLLVENFDSRNNVNKFVFLSNHIQYRYSTIIYYQTDQSCSK